MRCRPSGLGRSLVRGGLIPLLAVGDAEGVRWDEFRVSVVIVGLGDLTPFFSILFRNRTPNPPPFSPMNSIPVASRAHKVAARCPFSIFLFLPFA
jgi:hypothetical protein